MIERNSNQDYINKSLWKEDEVFIKNVKQVYVNNANEAQMYTKFGIVAWDYATTMNTFNENFLMAPVIKNNEVVASVITRRIGNKVFFKFTKKDEQVKDFFKPIIFGDRKNITISNNSDAIYDSNLTSRTISVCRTYTFTVGEIPDAGAQSDIIITKTVCKVINEITADDTCIACSDSGGGDEIDGSGGGYFYKVDEKDPCEIAKESSLNATNISKTTAYSTAKTTITEMNNGKENGVVLGLINNSVQTSNVQTGNNYSIGNLTSNFVDPIGDMHNHPNNSPPSPGDVYSLINIRNQFSNYNTRYVFLQDGTTYALTITDADAMNLFLEGYPPPR